MAAVAEYSALSGRSVVVSGAQKKCPAGGPGTKLEENSLGRIGALPLAKQRDQENGGKYAR